MLKKVSNVVKKGLVGLGAFLFIHAVQAADTLAQSLDGDVGDSLGGGATFWKIFVLVDIIFATGMAVKTKNPMVFLGVFVVAFVPGFLIKAFVFN